MPTSANERLGRLFANKSLPPKPDLENLDATNVGKTTLSPNPMSERPGTDSHHLEGSNLSENSDDDDYVAAFSQIPRMKPIIAKKHLKPKAGALRSREDNNSESSKPIKFIPKGKTSLNLSPSSDAPDVEEIQTPPDLGGSDESSSKKFCQFSLVSKFPYKYMDDPQDRVSRLFFANNTFYERTWNLYYLHPPRSSLRGPLLLVPLSEVQFLLDQISTAFGIQMEVPGFPFTLKFSDDGTPQPVFLGETNSREEVRTLSDNIPEAEADHGECPQGAASDVESTFDHFRKKCEKAWLASKGKGKGVAGKTKVKNNLQAVQESQNQIKRAGRYLGLRPRTKPVDRPEGLSWTEEKENEEAQLRSCGLLIDFLDVNKPSQYPFDGESVVVSVDIEWYERDNSLITEVGISVLDTLDLVGLAPGSQGENWIKQVRSRHFRIKGREHLVNRDFCVGDPNAFRFGKSEFVALDEISATVDSCFEWPFSVQFKEDGPHTTQHERDTEAALSTVEVEKAQKGPRQRNLILLGHDVGNDLSYLQKLGSEVFNAPSAGHRSLSHSPESSRHQILSSVLETLDTTILYQSLHKETQPRSLAHICSEMGIDAWHLHNGGNDARYTLECFIKIAIKARLMEDEAQKKKGSPHDGVLEDEMEAARLRRIDEKMYLAREKIRKDNAAIIQAKSAALPETSLPVRVSEPVWSEPEDFGAAWSTAPKRPRAGW